MSLANAVRQVANGTDANVAKVLLDLKSENTQMRAQLARLEGADAAGAKRARLLASPAPSDASAADLEATCRTKGFCFRFNKGSCPEAKCRYKHRCAICGKSDADCPKGASACANAYL